MPFAEALTVPTIAIGLEAAGTLGTLCAGGIVAAGRLIVGYLRERDRARDEALRVKDEAYAATLKDELQTRTGLAKQFTDRIEQIEVERRETTKALLEIGRQTATVIAQVEAALRSLSVKIESRAYGLPAPPAGRARRTNDPPEDR